MDVGRFPCPANKTCLSPRSIPSGQDQILKGQILLRGHMKNSNGLGGPTLEMASTLCLFPR